MRLAKPLAPGATIGILGGGQLGRMLTQAASRLGFKCHILAPEGDNPAFQIAAAHTAAAYLDREALARFASSVDVVTYEFENVPGETAAFLEARIPLAPNAEALRVAQDRLDEKNFLAGLGIPVAPYAPVNSRAELEKAAANIGLPSILKTRRLGYDGKGQKKIANQTDVASAFAELGEAPAILEGVINFELEVSAIAARGWDASTAVYDIPENEHRNHILQTATVPANIVPNLATKAASLARRILEALDYVGVIGIEMFVTREGLIVNELAPRVHNSGHWTMDACAISQFEQHIRAICGWPLGDPGRHSDVVMTNLLGDEVKRWQELAAEPNLALHLYGKAESRPGRKMGHVNRLTPRQA